MSSNRVITSRALLAFAADINSDVSWTLQANAVEQILQQELRYWSRIIIPIYHYLKKTDALKNLPELARRILQNKFMELLSVQTRQQHWLKRVVDSICEKQIQVILLKGAAAMGTIYEPRYSRLSQDIDLLVRRNDFQRLIDLMMSLGYRKPANNKRLFSEKMRHEQHVFLDTPIEFNIEVHDDLIPHHMFRIRLEDFWNRSKLHPLFNSEFIRIPCLEDSLIHCAIHSFLHLEFEPHHLVDAVRILHKGPDLNRVLQIAESWGCLKILGLLSEQMELWFNEPIFDHSDILNTIIASRMKKLFHSPQNPSIRDPKIFEQLGSMLMQDSYHQVVVFCAYYLYKRLMDYLYWTHYQVKKL